MGGEAEFGGDAGGAGGEWGGALGEDRAGFELGVERGGEDAGVPDGVAGGVAVVILGGGWEDEGAVQGAVVVELFAGVGVVYVFAFAGHVVDAVVGCP